MLPSAQNSMTTRSKPTPTPPCGGAPYLQAAQDRLSRLLFCVEFRLSQWVTNIIQGARTRFRYHMDSLEGVNICLNRIQLDAMHLCPLCVNKRTDMGDDASTYASRHTKQPHCSLFCANHMLTCQQLGVVDTLRARNDLLATDEHIEGVADLWVIRAWHRVEWPHLH
jgi:hypothetical protein